MKKTLSIFLAIGMFSLSTSLSAAPIGQSAYFMGSGITPFVFEPYVEVPPLYINGAKAAEMDYEEKTRSQDHGYYAGPLDWENVVDTQKAKFRNELDRMHKEQEDWELSYSGKARDRTFPIEIGDFNENFSRFVFSEKARGAQMVYNVGTYGLSLRSLIVSPEDDADQEWNRPTIIGERQENEITGAGGLGAPWVDRISTGVNTVQSRYNERAYHPAPNSRMEIVDITTELFGVYKNRIEIAQNTDSRILQAGGGETSWGSALFIQNEASFKHRLGTTAFSFNFDHIEPGYFAVETNIPARERQGITAGITHSFNERIQTALSFRSYTDTVFSKTPYSMDVQTPSVSVTVKPFSSAIEFLKNARFTFAVEQRSRREMKYDWIDDDRDTVSMIFKNRFRKWTFQYGYARNKDFYNNYGYEYRHDRHRFRIDYALKYKDVEITPFFSADAVVPEHGTGQEETRAGIDLEKQFEKRFKLQTQLYAGVLRQQALVSRGTEMFPLVGMDVSMNLVQGCYVTGSLRMAGPEYGYYKPTTTGDIKFSMKF